jgi:hypothetical protein
MDAGMRKMISDAQAHVRKMKRAAPYIYPEYTNLQVAESEFKLARERLKFARAAWKNLGQPIK